MYSNLPPEVRVELCNMKGYELGAWVYAFKKYNKYKVYMFIQDTLIPNQRIPNFDSIHYEPGTVYTFHHTATVGGGGYYDDLKDVYDNTSFQYIADMDSECPIVGSAHSSFMLDRDHAPMLLALEEPYEEKMIIKSKIDSWLTERTFGIVADKLNLKRVNIWDYFTKIHGNRY
jgi:hypothetical protein